MSHMVKIRAKITDLEALRRAVSKMGGTFHENRTQYTTYGSSRNECTHAISFPSTRMEVGVVKQEDGSYTLECDNMLYSTIGQNGNKLLAYYEAEKAYMEGFNMGYVVCEPYEVKDELIVEMEVEV